MVLRLEQTMILLLPQSAVVWLVEVFRCISTG